MNVIKSATFVLASAAMVHGASSTAQPVRLLRTIGTEGPVNAVAWNPPGTRLAIMSDFGGRIKVLEMPEANPEESFNPGLSSYAENSLAFLDDTSLLTPGHLPFQPETLISWSLSSAKELRIFATPDNPKAHGRADQYVASSDGSSVAVLTSDRRSGAEGFDGHSGVILWMLPQYQGFHFVALAFSHSGAELAVSTSDGRVLILDPRTGLTVRTLQVHSPSSDITCSSLAFSPDDRFIVAGRAKRSI